MSLTAPLQTSQLCLRSPLQMLHVTARFICTCSNLSVTQELVDVRLT